jgi:hypothetical protein
MVIYKKLRLGKFVLQKGGLRKMNSEGEVKALEVTASDKRVKCGILDGKGGGVSASTFEEFLNCRKAFMLLPRWPHLPNVYKKEFSSPNI